MAYFQHIKTTVITSFLGLRLSLKHLFQATKKRNQNIFKTDFFSTSDGTTTLQFPHELIPVPDHGRYKLHNEIDDCIVCDKCAKVCPVNCIEIVPIRSVDSFGETSDGTPKRIYAETFNIDMGKCMFCGLCTTVCPTECLTMTSEYDYSTFDIREHVFPFGNMTGADVELKRKEWEDHQRQMSETAAMPSSAPANASSTGGVKPVFKPRPTPNKPIEESGSVPDVAKPKPVFKPRIVPPKPRNE